MSKRNSLLYFCILVVLISSFMLGMRVKDMFFSDKEPEVYEAFTKENMTQAFEYGYRKGIADMTIGNYNVKVAVDSFKIILEKGE